MPTSLSTPSTRPLQHGATPIRTDSRNLNSKKCHPSRWKGASNVPTSTRHLPNGARPTRTGRRSVNCRRCRPRRPHGSNPISRQRVGFSVARRLRSRAREKQPTLASRHLRNAWRIFCIDSTKGLRNPAPDVALWELANSEPRPNKNPGRGWRVHRPALKPPSAGKTVPLTKSALVAEGRLVEVLQTFAG